MRRIRGAQKTDGYQHYAEILRAGERCGFVIGQFNVIGAADGPQGPGLNQNRPVQSDQAGWHGGVTGGVNSAHNWGLIGLV